MSIAQRHRYEDSPISEAIYEIFVKPRPDVQFEQAPVEILRQRFQDFTQEERLQSLQLSWKIEPQGAVHQGHHPRGERIRRWNNDRTRLIQFGPDMCAFNVLKPYKSFEEHLLQAKALFKTYIAECEPLSIERVGQRYINVIRLPPDADSGAEYFEIYPRLPEQLRNGHPSLAVQLETVRFEQGSTIVNLGFRGIEEGQAVYLLDVYARSTTPVACQLDDIIAWQYRAHDAIGQSFELSITDKSRKLFREVTQ